MIRDIVRTACVVVVMAVAASLIVEVRHRLAVIDFAARLAPQPQAYAWAPPPAPEPEGRLAGLGRATLRWADAALGVVR